MHRERAEQRQELADESGERGQPDPCEHRDEEERRELGRRSPDAAEVVDPTTRRDEGEDDRVYFGATITVRNTRKEERTVSIVGVDEIDTTRGYISWVSPMARALLKAREGDTVTLNTPGGVEELDIMHVRYEQLATGGELAGSSR